MTQITPELAAAFDRLVMAEPLAEAATLGGAYRVYASRDGKLFLLATLPGPAAAPATWTTHRSYAAAVRAMADLLEADEAAEIAESPPGSDTRYSPGMHSWPFTQPEKRAIREAYEALTRVGNATAERGKTDTDGDFTPDGWQGILDRAHHDLGLVILTIEAQEREQR